MRYFVRLLLLLLSLSFLGWAAGLVCWRPSEAAQQPTVRPDSSALILVMTNWCPFGVEVFMRMDSAAYNYVGTQPPQTQAINVFPSALLGAAITVQFAGIPAGTHEIAEWPPYVRKPSTIGLIRLTTCTPPPQPERT